MKKPTAQRVALIACCATKLSHRAPAADLYCSPLFRMSLGWAKANADVTYVLSAKHGLVALDQQIEPYNETLCTASVLERRQWSVRVAAQIASAIPASATLIFLAGQAYRRDLLPLLRNTRIEIPMEGLGIGRQLAFLKKQQPCEVFAHRAQPS